MTYELVPFQLHLTGDIADHHRFHGYDGFMALAGFAWTLSLVTNYAVTGKIRQRGDFDGRSLVHATAPSEGSVVVDFIATLTSSPDQVFGGVVAGVSGGVFLQSLIKRVLSRNLGEESPEADRILLDLIKKRGGDIEALVAINEAPIRQTHSVIGNGAQKMEIASGFNLLNTFTPETKDYVSLNVEDSSQVIKEFSVSAFNVNSGYGSVFDHDLGRVVPFSMSRDTLRKLKAQFSWGLDQYATGKGGKVQVKFSRILAMDGTPKRYIILNAKRASAP
jgi:nitrogen regulatory protein PII